MTDLTPYEEKIIAAFNKACAQNEEKEGKSVGASAAEVTEVMNQEGTLAKLDTVIDIADQMGDLRSRGYL